MMKTDSFSKTCIIATIAVIIALLLIFIGCKAGNQQIPENEYAFKVLYYKQNCERMSNVINAYHDLLHRIWIDHPSYVEDILIESEEYFELEQYIDDDEHSYIFSFKDTRDSVEYNANKNVELYNDPGCINKRTK